jgi:WD40 repeat protein
LWKCSQGTWDKKEEMEKITTIRQAMKPKDRIEQVTITNDGIYLLAGTSFGLVYVYNIGRNPPQLVRIIETGSNGGMYSLVVTGDDTTIITSGGTNNWKGEDGAGVIDVWNIKTGKRIYKLGNLGSWPLVALQGNSLIFGSFHRFWVEDIKTGKKTLMHPRQKDGAVSTLAISKSKTIMVSAGWDNRIVNIWSIPSFGLKMSVPTRHNYHTARISPDDKSVVLGSSDGTIVVMDLQSGNIIREIQAHANFEPGIHSIFVSPDGKYIISKKPGIEKVFQISDGKEVTDNSVCNIPLGEVIAQSANDYIVANKVNDGNDKITVHSTVGRALLEVDLSPYSYGVADSALLSPDEQYVFFALRTSIKSGTIIQFSRDSGKIVQEVGTNSCCVLAANKKYLISGGDDKRAVIWDIATGKQLRRLYGHQDVISAIQIVDDMAITAAFDGQIFVWSLPGGKLSKILRHQ